MIDKHLPHTKKSKLRRSKAFIVVALLLGAGVVGSVAVAVQISLDSPATLPSDI